MTFQTSLSLIVLGSIAAFLLGIAIAVWSRRPVIQRLEGECRALQAQLDGSAHALGVANAEKQQLEEELVTVRRELQAGVSRNEQLRDVVKIHVARRREFDEWAGPIKSSLGEAVGQALRTLKDQLARQESVLQRQERLVAEAQDQYRAKRDEIERMRRELSIKNYHIAALNERFIRIEERIGDLSAHVGGRHAPAGRSAVPAADDAVSAGDVPQATDRQAPLALKEKAPEDWTDLLDEWHRRLDRRFGQLDDLQAGLRGRLDAGAPPSAARFGEARVGGDSATIQ